jgi:hypothetical protein
MSRIFLFVMTAVILASCSPTKRLARLLERYPMEATVDTVYRDTVIYRDTTVYRYLPGESVTNNVYFKDTVDVPDTVIMAETRFAFAAAHLTDNKLGLELLQKDTVIKFVLDSVLVHNIDTIIVTKDIPYPVIEKPKPLYKYGFFILGALVLIAMFLLFAFRRK